MRLNLLFKKCCKFLAAGAIASLSFGAMNSATAADTIRVGHFSWPGYGFYYVNQHHNLSPDLNFEFTIIEDPVQLFALLGIVPHPLLSNNSLRNFALHSVHGLA